MILKFPTNFFLAFKLWQLLVVLIVGIVAGTFLAVKKEPFMEIINSN